MNFIVVQVDQDYDYVEGVRHIASFPTEDAANTFVQKKAKSKPLHGVKEWITLKSGWMRFSCQKTLITIHGANILNNTIHFLQSP